MQHQRFQNKPDNPLFLVPSKDYFVPIPREHNIVPISSFGLNAQSAESIDSLVARAKLQVLGVTETLTQIQIRDKSVDIYPIIAPFAPFFLAMTEMNFDMPPKASRSITINITRKGRAKPEYFPE